MEQNFCLKNRVLIIIGLLNLRYSILTTYPNKEAWFKETFKTWKQNKNERNQQKEISVVIRNLFEISEEWENFI